MSTSERTLIVIKRMPRGFPIREFAEGELIQEIKSTATASGLVLEEFFVSQLTKDVLEFMYPDLTPSLQRETLAHLRYQFPGIYVFKGFDALRKMRAGVGENANPALCGKDTIRYRWWLRTKDHHQHPDDGETGIDLGNGERYWFNFVHCTRTAQEFNIQYAALSDSRFRG